MFIWKSNPSLWCNSIGIYTCRIVDKEVAFDGWKISVIESKFYFTNLKIRISKNKSTHILNEITSVRFRDLLSWGS